MNELNVYTNFNLDGDFLEISTHSQHWEDLIFQGDSKHFRSMWLQPLILLNSKLAQQPLWRRKTGGENEGACAYLQDSM